MNAIYFTKEINNKQITKLNKKIKKHKQNIDMIVVSRNLKNNQNFMENIMQIDIPIVDGKWLFKFLVVQVLEYIIKSQNKKIRDISIAFIVDTYNDLILYYIKILIGKVKNFTIVTKNRGRYRNIEEELFNEEGEILLITNNRRKSLKNVDIIFNFDYNNEKINSFIINEQAIIINLKEKIDIKTKRFNGININDYEINFKNRFIEMLEWIEQFENRDIYESYLYKIGNIKDIMNIINKDKVKIKNLIGNNGVISKKEYEKLY